MHTDTFWMQRCLELAANGKGQVQPNPFVGAILVQGDEVIGQGFHREYGGPHAEVHAFNSVPPGKDLSDACLYVNLEPCSHIGKTPPCADMIVRNKLKRVVIGTIDPNPLVSGAGIKKIEQSGIEVKVDVLSAECRKLNAAFFCYHEKKRPYVILKWAETANGYFAPLEGKQAWISNSLSRQLVHQWRAEAAAILVGYRTVTADNPELTVRLLKGNSPLPIVIDPKAAIKPPLNLFDTHRNILVVNNLYDKRDGNVQYLRVGKENWIPDLFQYLYEQKVQTLIVEGGERTLRAFIELKLWDEARLIVASQTWENGIRAPKLDGIEFSSYRLASDTIKILYPC